MDINSLLSLGINAKGRSIYDLFDDKFRARKFSLVTSELFLDYSKQNITEHEFSQLTQWASDKGLSEAISAQFSGEIINSTEKRAVLHSVLRAPDEIKRDILGKGADDVISTEHNMATIVDDIRNGQRLSVTGKPFSDVIAIGIGGSYYGVKIALSALAEGQPDTLSVHVVANVDGEALKRKLDKLNPETTLVVVISKTFTTQETLLNADSVKRWMLASNNDSSMIKNHWFAISSNVNKAEEFGLQADNILPMWDWVGGRFSLWSAVGFPLALAIGNEKFAELKAGAYAMDVHFTKQPFSNNMPVIMALLGIWNRNVLNYPSLAILPYNHALRALPGYLQQTDMESNGKAVSLEGRPIPWLTAPIVFGQEGTNGQHAFMQLMHQSQDIIPTDFIVALNGVDDYKSHHQVLVANCFAQSEALMQGKTLEQAVNELSAQGLPFEDIERLAPHKTMKGNTPSNTLTFDELTPKTLGALIALYEHKIFVQGVLWEINSFDQWGVELGKTLSQQILEVMEGNENTTMSSSTLHLIERFNK